MENLQYHTLKKVILDVQLKKVVRELLMQHDKKLENAPLR